MGTPWEVEELTSLVELHQRWVRVETLVDAPGPQGKSLPVFGLVIGTEDRSAPTFGLFGGVHGLERIGAQTALSFLHSFLENLRWDDHLRSRLERQRIVAIPVVNPWGLTMGRRSNARGVDLMRNAPVEAQAAPPRLVGGHRLGAWLPWYRGPEGAPMEPEANALCEFVQREMFEARVSVALDLHSGFGMRDRLWYPYAKQVGGFPRAREAQSLGRLLDETYPNHVYKVEPQSVSYTTHGDLWDHLFDLHWAKSNASEGEAPPLFLPWTLEMGSWAWLRKNPRQIFSAEGPFNPIRPHRLRRVLRRHITLIDFLFRASGNSAAWAVS